MRNFIDGDGFAEGGATREDSHQKQKESTEDDRKVLHCADPEGTLVESLRCCDQTSQLNSS